MPEIIDRDLEDLALRVLPDIFMKKVPGLRILAGLIICERLIIKIRRTFITDGPFLLGRRKKGTA